MLKRILILSTLGLLASVHAPEVHKGHADEIEIAFCYVSNDWAKPNTTIYAGSRSEADIKGKKKGLTFCKRGPCAFDGEFRPADERCE